MVINHERTEGKPCKGKSSSRLVESVIERRLYHFGW